MKINPISFGRTVRVNAPLKVAEHAAELANCIPTKKGESRVQQQLQTFFYDVEQGEGRARAIAPLGKKGPVYIVTGEESKEVGKVLANKKEQLAIARKNYGNNEMFEMVKDRENENLKNALISIIEDTLEPVDLNLDYSQKKHRIKSINILF